MFNAKRIARLHNKRIFHISTNNYLDYFLIIYISRSTTSMLTFIIFFLFFLPNNTQTTKYPIQLLLNLLVYLLRIATTLRYVETNK